VHDSPFSSQVPNLDSVLADVIDDVCCERETLPAYLCAEAAFKYVARPVVADRRYFR